MKANELRIGNLILNPHLNKIYTVSGIKNHSTIPNNYMVDTLEFPDGAITIELFEGIPLTAEWMGKLGLGIIYCNAEQEREWGWGDKDFFLTQRYTYLQLHGENKTIDYVHELQNLYYALMGVELSLMSTTSAN